MHPFDLRQPTTASEAVATFRASPDPMYLAGGMTLVPTLKAHLAAPRTLIDLAGIAEMTGIHVDGDGLRIGALTRWVDIEGADALRATIPALARMAAMIGDRHVRNRGTIGGSIANNDPAADMTAAVLGLGATLITDRRSLGADDYFTGMFQTALEDGEILVAITFPRPLAAAYAKHPHPASGYAVGGVFVARFASHWRVAVTGSGQAGVFRLHALETALATAPAGKALAQVDFTALDLVDDPAFPARFRAQMLRWLASDALDQIG